PASATQRGLIRASGSSAKSPPHRRQAARDLLRARRWSAPCAGRSGSACWRGRRRRCNRRRCSRAPASRLCSGVRLEPAETVGGPAARVVFTANKTLVTEAVQFSEQERIIQLLAVRLVARGNTGDLEITLYWNHFPPP